MFWAIPWSVTIGNVTKVQPPGTSLPLTNSTLMDTTNNLNLTVLVFSLPDGRYNFTVNPTSFSLAGPDYFLPDSGVVDVNGTNVLIQVQLEAYCISSTSTGTH
jgi:hypothetical protein